MQQNNPRLESGAKWMADAWDVLVLLGIGALAVCSSGIAFFFDSTDIDVRLAATLILGVLLAMLGSHLRQDLAARRRDRRTRDFHETIVKRLDAMSRRIDMVGRRDHSVHKETVEAMARRMDVLARRLESVEGSRREMRPKARKPAASSSWLARLRLS